MSELNGEQFRMQTNMKAKPGSQGTLFQGGKPVDAHRYPRGYTPARMQEVTAALNPTRKAVRVTARGTTELDGPEFVDHVVKDPAEQLAATKAGNKGTCPTCKGAGVTPERSYVREGFAANEPDKTIHVPSENCWQCGGTDSKPGRGREPLRDMLDQTDMSPHGRARFPNEYPAVAGKTGIEDETEIIPAKGHRHPWLNPQGDLHIREAIARSTVPVEHLKRVNRLRVSNDQGMKRQNAAGHFAYGNIGIETLTEKAPTSVKRKAKEAEDASGTLIHEIGHAAGAMGGHHEEDEAKADAYMLQHQRTDPRNARRGVKGHAWLYSVAAGDGYDPDHVTAPGETEPMKQERLVRSPATAFRKTRLGVAGRPRVQQTLF